MTITTVPKKNNEHKARNSYPSVGANQPTVGKPACRQTGL